MDTLVLICLVVLVSLAVQYAMRTAKRYLPTVISETVVVNTRDGNSIRGALVASHGDVIVLKGAVYLGATDGDVTIDGEAIIPRERVEWIQRAGGAS